MSERSSKVASLCLIFDCHSSVTLLEDESGGQTFPLSGIVTRQASKLK